MVVKHTDLSMPACEFSEFFMSQLTQHCRCCRSTTQLQLSTHLQAASSLRPPRQPRCPCRRHRGAMARGAAPAPAAQQLEATASAANCLRTSRRRSSRSRRRQTAPSSTDSGRTRAARTRTPRRGSGAGICSGWPECASLVSEKCRLARWTACTLLMVSNLRSAV